MEKEITRFARRSGSKNTLVSKEIYEGRRKDEMTKSTVYTFSAKRSLQRSPQI